MKAARVSSRSREEMFTTEAASQGAAEEALWPWPARIAFMVGAAVLCWAVPLAILYAVLF